MIAEFLISTIGVGILGSIIIYRCRTGKQEMEEELNSKVEKLEQTYLDERVKNNENIEKLRIKLDETKKEFSSRKVKSKA